MLTSIMGAVVQHSRWQRWLIYFEKDSYTYKWKK